jgi:hypothetical protein
MGTSCSIQVSLGLEIEISMNEKSELWLNFVMGVALGLVIAKYKYKSVCCFKVLNKKLQ